MAGHEQVVGAFLRIGVAHQAAPGADRAKLGEAAGDQFVGIDLVARVPDQPVAAEVEDPMKGEAELDHAEVGGEVGGAGGGHLAEGPPHLTGQVFRAARRRGPAGRGAT